MRRASNPSAAFPVRLLSGFHCTLLAYDLDRFFNIVASFIKPLSCNPKPHPSRDLTSLILDMSDNLRAPYQPQRVLIQLVPPPVSGWASTTVFVSWSWFFRPRNRDRLWKNICVYLIGSWVASTSTNSSMPIPQTLGSSSRMASATAVTYNLTARIASSLPGIT
ncbi:MAG: hypothetical protein CM1200mP9_07130 [Gammaproteobacteria bacterium]|nr:MAG: hypothetical protein CM1200mP9_07130 [Gammaproteobacteria bacterium]